MHLRATSLLAASVTVAALLGAPTASAEDAPPAASAPGPRLPPPVPPYLVQKEPPQLYSPGLAVAGIVVGSAGFLSALTGLILMSGQPDKCEPNLACTSTKHDIGFGMLLAGAPVLGIGVGMAIFGTRPVTPAAATAGVPVVAIGPTGGSLRWQF